MLVQEAMAHEPITIWETSTIKAAIQLLDLHSITAMPVVDGNGRLLGIVSESDLIQDVVTRDPRALERAVTIDALYPPTTVADVYTRMPVTVCPADDIVTAIELMTATGAKSLPVLDDRHHLVGVISRSDVVHALARADETIASDIGSRLSTAGHDDWYVEVVDGVVSIAGPSDTGQVALARLLARTAAGVVDVRIPID